MASAINLGDTQRPPCALVVKRQTREHVGVTSGQIPAKTTHTATAAAGGSGLTAV